MINNSQLTRVAIGTAAGAVVGIAVSQMMKRSSRNRMGRMGSSMTKKLGSFMSGIIGM